MKVLFFDTESTDLAASWGRLLCASFATLDGEVYTIKTKGRTKVDDSRIAIGVRRELESADIVVGWNSKLHDVPLVNARLSKHGERAIHIGEKYGGTHVDLMWYAAGSSMKIGGRSLATVSKYFNVRHAKTPLTGDVWQLAGAGDKSALDLVVEHCEADVLVLRDLWPHLAPYVKNMTFTLSEVHHVISDIPTRRR